MKSFKLRAVLLGGSVLLGFAARAQQPAGISVSVPASSLTFINPGVPDLGPARVAPAYGDLKKTDHGTFVKWPSGFSSSPHIHSYDYFAVVISGVVVNFQPGGKQIPLPQGSYWFQKANEVHVTKCISKQGCEFLLYMRGPFDHIVKN